MTPKRSYVIEVAFRWFADCLARHRCGPCAGQDPHDVCDQPDWNRLGAEVLAQLNPPEPIRIDDAVVQKEAEAVAAMAHSLIDECSQDRERLRQLRLAAADAGDSRCDGGPPMTIICCDGCSTGLEPPAVLIEVAEGAQARYCEECRDVYRRWVVTCLTEEHRLNRLLDLWIEERRIHVPLRFVPQDLKLAARQRLAALAAQGVSLG